MIWILGLIIYLLIMKIVDLKHDLDEAIKIKRQIEDSFYEHHYNKIRRQLKRNKDAA